MKRIMIMCGTGVATSTLAVNRVRTWLEEKNLDKNVKIYQARILDQLDKLDEYDVVISTAILDNDNNGKILNGLPILTGEGLSELFFKIETALMDDKDEEEYEKYV